MTIMTRNEMWNRHTLIGKLPQAEQKAAYTALHREYYGAYVERFKIRAPLHLAAACQTALKAGDEYFNSPFTGLRHWDACEQSTKLIPGLLKACRDNGEGWSLSTNTCLLKEAMRRHLAKT